MTKTDAQIDPVKVAREAFIREYLREPSEPYEPAFDSVILGARAMQAATAGARGAVKASQAATDGYTLIPNAALLWLNGEGSDDKGHHFGDGPEAERIIAGRRAAFWWREVFRRMIDTDPTPDTADDIRRQAREEALEEAARLAEKATGYDDIAQRSAGCMTRGEAIAAAIRALSTKPPPNCGDRG